MGENHNSDDSGFNKKTPLKKRTRGFINKMFKTIYEGDSFNRLYIMRGLPGSGKSTEALWIGGLTFSKDDFFMTYGAYKFDIERARKAMDEGISRIIIDNTNISAWELRPYVESGLKNEYTIVLAEPRTPYRWDVKILAQKIFTMFLKR